MLNLYRVTYEESENGEVVGNGTYLVYAKSEDDAKQFVLNYESADETNLPDLKWYITEIPQEEGIVEIEENVFDLDL